MQLFSSLSSLFPSWRNRLLIVLVLCAAFIVLHLSQPSSSSSSTRKGDSPMPAADAAVKYLLSNSKQQQEAQQKQQQHKDIVAELLRMPVIPHSSQRARAERWKLVTKHVDVLEARRAISHHRALCRNASTAIRFSDLVERNLSLTETDFKFVVYNFARGRSQRKWKQPGVVGYRRIFVAIDIPPLRWRFNSSSSRSSSSSSSEKIASSFFPHGGRICSHGAVFVARLESRAEKVDVGVAMEISVAPGLHEIQAFIRRGRTYRLCLLLQAVNSWFQFRMRRDTFLDNIWSGDPQEIRPIATAERAKAEKALREFNFSARALRRHKQNRPPVVVSGTFFETAMHRGLWYMWRGAPGTPKWCVAQPVEQQQCFAENMHVSRASERQLAESLRTLRNGRRCGSTLGRGEGNRDQTDLDDFSGGEWRRLAECDGDSCVGEPMDAMLPEYLTAEERRRELNKTGPWTFVSDTCTLKLHSKLEAARVMAGKWLLHWGSSTLKEPAQNFLEYFLGIPSQPRIPNTTRPAVMMEQLRPLPPRNVSNRTSRQMHNMLRDARHLSYRRFDTNWVPLPALANNSSSSSSSRNSSTSTRKSTRSTLCWGGCPKISTGRPTCGAKMGLATTQCVAEKLGESTEELPTAIIMNHFDWRSPLGNETAFMLQLDEKMKWLTQLVREKLQRQQQLQQHQRGCIRKPMLIWVGASARIHDSTTSRGYCGAENGRALERHLAWKVESYMRRWRKQVLLMATEQQRKQRECFSTTTSDAAAAAAAAFPFRDIVYLDRPSLTYPLQFGGLFALNGIHFGQTRGVCRTKGYDLEEDIKNCVRSVAADWALKHMFLNTILE